ncbi:DUF1266 domain-containing protein [Streptomyces boluensis]|uniref:DUF1266 domain-containing protein n=1 Tax=Streptomyces boluensis TaxID=1775135 RepID=A0A964XNE9_9ACTN|nr:DUF1266 domain-containing protein [Streptomyces boluensis]NBE53513.1 DUF1266 domain-containing protein [Streptomyces boluensis]
MSIWNAIRDWGRPRAERTYPAPLTRHQLWMVSLSAPVHRAKDASRTTLYPYRRVDEAKARRALAGHWEISSREALLPRLRDLAHTGYRARARQRYGVSPLAWDVALYADITRTGFAAGYVTEAEAWTALKDVVPVVARTYGSWQEYATDYLLGRKIWTELLRGTEYEDFPAPQADSDAHLRRLLDPANPSSPWVLAPYEAISGPDGPRSGQQIPG